MSEPEFNRVAWTMGGVFTVLGVSALATARYSLLEKTEDSSLLRWLALPYRIMGISWIGGSQRRYLYQIGTVFLVIGTLLVLGRLGVW